MNNNTSLSNKNQYRNKKTGFFSESAVKQYIVFVYNEQLVYQLTVLYQIILLCQNKWNYTRERNNSQAIFHIMYLQKSTYLHYIEVSNSASKKR